MTKLWWIRRDPCGLFSAILTVGLLVYAQVVVTKIVILPWMGFNIHLILYTACTILALIAHTRSQFSDPGAVPRFFTPPELPRANLVYDPANPPPPGPKICKGCRTLKPSKAYHCSTCERCIVRMDHHCPWINNCVGLFNQKFFILFLFYTGLACIYSGALLVARFFSCSNSPRQCNISGFNSALCIITFVEALVFGLFVIIMMFDQFSALFDADAEAMEFYEKQLDEYNESMRRGEANYAPMPTPPESKSRYACLIEVFGTRFSLGWFLPFSLPNEVQQDFNSELKVCRKHAEKCVNAIVDHISRTMKQHDEYNSSQPQLQSQSQPKSTDITLKDQPNSTENESELKQRRVDVDTSVVADDENTVPPSPITGKKTL